MTDNIYNYGYRVSRFDADFRLILQLDHRQPESVVARCTNLSEGGLGAEIKVSLEIGTEVTLILTLPGSSPSMRITAKVIHRRGEDYGFAFIFSSQSQQIDMRDYIESWRSRLGHSSDLLR